MPGARGRPAQRRVEPTLQRGMYVRVADCRVALRRPPTSCMPTHQARIRSTTSFAPWRTALCATCTSGSSICAVPRPSPDGLLRLAHSSRPPARSVSQHTTQLLLQPKNVATAGCLRGAGGRVKPGTRAWDGLLEALRANLIAALFLNGMCSYAVWLAQPLQDVHRSTPCSLPV